jgi:hypothetical protein
MLYCGKIPFVPSEQITALERLLARKKQLHSLAVSLDGYERWGRGGDEAFASRAAAELQEAPAILAELKSQIANLKQSAPEVLVAWAEAHIELLDDYVTRVPADSTEAFVARGEREKWVQVRDGSLDYVEENSVYVKPHPEVYERLFGFAPPKLHW